jgi:hypothetical protein
MKAARAEKYSNAIHILQNISISLIQRPKYTIWRAQRRHSRGHGIGCSTVKTDMHLKHRLMFVTGGGNTAHMIISRQGNVMSWSNAWHGNDEIVHRRIHGYHMHYLINVKGTRCGTPDSYLTLILLTWNIG